MPINDINKYASSMKQNLKIQFKTFRKQINKS